jgi:predicted nucleic acid-binding protein
MPSSSTSTISSASSRVAEPPAVNASPLIFLARAGLLDLLRLISSELVVRAPVATELSRRGPDDPAARALGSTDWLTVVPASPIPAVIQSWDLGPGESAVLAWCYARPGTEAIVDDLAARRCADALGLPVRGTLGLVLLGKRHGRLSAARPVLETLRASGMRLSERVMNRALFLVGE